MGVSGMGVSGIRVGGLSVNVEVGDGINVGVFVTVGRCVAVRVAVGTVIVTFFIGTTVPGCWGTISPAFGTSIWTHTCAAEKGP